MKRIYAFLALIMCVSAAHAAAPVTTICTAKDAAGNVILCAPVLSLLPDGTVNTGGGGGGGGTIVKATAAAPSYTEGSTTNPLSTDLSGNLRTGTPAYRYQLFGTYGGSGQTSNATGTAVGPVLPNAYTFGCIGTIGGGTITLQQLGGDGVTWVNYPGISFTALPANAPVIAPNITGAPGSGSIVAPNFRAVLAGATSPSLWCTAS